MSWFGSSSGRGVTKDSVHAFYKHIDNHSDSSNPKARYNYNKAKIEGMFSGSKINPAVASSSDDLISKLVVKWADGRSSGPMSSGELRNVLQPPPNPAKMDEDGVLMINCKKCGEKIELDEDKIAVHAETCMTVVKTKLNTPEGILRRSALSPVRRCSLYKTVTFVSFSVQITSTAGGTKVHYCFSLSRHCHFHPCR